MAKRKSKKVTKKVRLKAKIRKTKKKKVSPLTRKPSFPQFAKRIKIRVIGIGGGGNSIVSEIAARMKKASFVVANTDLQALRTTSKKALRFQFGQEVTGGLGTGMNPELGREAAFKEKERIKKLLEGFDFCILVASLGGGTGSGAASVFAKISQELGNITYGIFTLPFKFEGRKKMEIAKAALRRIRPKLNIFSVIPNERIFQIIDKKTPLKKALSTINKGLAESLGGLIEVIYEPGLINIDFADFKTVLPGFGSFSEERFGKLAYLNTVLAERKGNSVQALVEEVLHNPLYPYSVSGAKGVLLNIGGEKKLSLAEVSQISETISKLVDKEAKIIFGISQSSKYSGLIKTTLLATGCTTKLFPQKNIKRKKKSRKKTTLKPSQSSSLTPPKKAKKAKKVKKASSKRRKKGSRSRKIKIKVLKVKTSSQKSSSLKRKKTKREAVSPEVKIRKNALQIRKESEAQEAEMLAREKFWETPAFLRKKIIE